MSSQINTANIDTNYPLPGNNNSQGLRDNFSAIKLALDSAKSEITNLQQSTAKINTATNFDGNLVQNIRLKNSYHLVPNVQTNSTLSYSNGSYQPISISGNTTYTLTGWPAGNNYANLRLAITPTSSTTMNIDFNAGTGVLKKHAGLTLPYSVSTTGTIFWEAWSADGGNTVYLRLIDGAYV